MALENTDFVRLMAAWALVHETADEGWKAAVERGSQAAAGEMSSGPDAFVDGLSAMIASEKERLKAELASGVASDGLAAATDARLEELRFEVAELRGRIESLTAAVEGLAARAQSD